jgi:rhodanese-related sulfurtransferase
MEDHNTRIIVFGADAAQAQTVAEALAKEAFRNVSYFAGSIENLKAALK